MFKFDFGSIDKNIRNAWIAALVAAGFTILLMLLPCIGNGLTSHVNIYQLVDVFILLGLSFGVFKRSRICVIMLFIYAVLNEIYIIKIGMNPSLIRIIFIYFYLQGLIAIFKWHKTAV